MPHELDAEDEVRARRHPGPAAALAVPELPRHLQKKSSRSPSCHGTGRGSAYTALPQVSEEVCSERSSSRRDACARLLSPWLASLGSSWLLSAALGCSRPLPRLHAPLPAEPHPDHSGVHSLAPRR